jgi:hypothetical protein
VQPAAPNLKVPIAIVIHAHPSNGILFIRPSHFPDLNQINDVQLTSPTTGQTLIYNSVTGVWSNQTPADPSPTNELQTLSTGTNTLTLSNGGGTVTVDTDPASDVTGSGTAGQVAYFTGTQTVTSESAFQYDAANDRVGIGTSPSAKLQIQSNTNGSEGIYLRNSNTGNAAEAYIGVFNNNSEGANFISYSSNHSAWANAVNFFTNSNNISQLNFVARNHRIGFWTNVTERMRILSTGEIGINIAAPAARLHVVGSGSTSTTWTAQFHNSATGGNNALMIRDDGNVGIGTASPSDRLHVQGTVRSSVSGAFASFAAQNPATDFPRALFLVGNTSSDVNVGLTVAPAFDNKPTFLTVTTHQVSNIDRKNATIRIQPTALTITSNSVVGQAGDPNGPPIYIATRQDNPTTVPAIFINNTNNQQVGINTPTPNASAQLEINSTNRGVLFPRMTTAQRDLITTPADGLVIYNTTDNKLQVRAAGAWVDLH